MKIIGGEFRSRVLESPPENTTTRPLPARVRESLFNLMRGHVEGAVVLDLFAGVGSFGLEAVSRGAAKVVMVERDKRVAAVLERNIRALGAEDRAEVLCVDALGPTPLARLVEPITMSFMDPPYDLVKRLAGWERVRLQASALTARLADDGYSMVRTPWPFWHAEGDEVPDPEAAEPKRRRGGKGKDRGRRSARAEPVEIIETIGGDEMIEMTPEEIEAEFAGLDLVDADEPTKTAKPTIVRTPADLTLPGALGPETHAYGTTAVHLYMRDGQAADPTA